MTDFLPGVEVGSKLTNLVAKIGGHTIAHLPPALVVVIDNDFDHMELASTS